jgi:hypothetical protein
VDFHHLLLAGFTGALTGALTPPQRTRRHTCS